MGAGGEGLSSSQPDFLSPIFGGGGDHEDGSEALERSDSFMADCPKCGMTFKYMHGNPLQIENHLNECFSQSLTQSGFVNRRRFLRKCLVLRE